MKTIESLGIYWSEIDPGSQEMYQDEVVGLIFYGYWSGRQDFEFLERISTFSSIWGGAAELNAREWDGEWMCNFSIEAKILTWPDGEEWKSVLEDSLKWFVENGAAISWCGSESCSPSLEVLDPESGAGSVYAIYSKDLGFSCGSELMEEYKDVDDAKLLAYGRNILAREG
ncbi:hypothetical protein HNP46_007164 [Pseudomonas nitritireducens]|uniref:Uncharacterized protein n=1 Tax=Pseudomonas nitroreducens TaxID=46680 RepID=A0A7W7KSQ4_PSENT|nr:hypothetical protein [Pseudomonas nitritireducens]MBB4868244.1 hypothetical protein [Pseudomonas nitritireducens]